MSKRLSEMTLEELWRLFPIELRPHDVRWKAWYAEQETRLRDILPSGSLHSIEHIGSTAVETIWAKPIVDIMIRLSDGADPEEIAAILVRNGYVRMNGTAFNMGYTENGFAEKVFHIHLRRLSEDDEIYFRDRLIARPEIAKEYEKLKLGLWKKYEFDRDGYTNAKTEFVRAQTRAAKTRFENIDNADFGKYAPEIFGILAGNTPDADYDSWYRAVSEGMKKSARKIILIKYGGALAGFFQYYVNADTFMMEEIQIRPEYRHEYGLFRALYGFLLPDMPEDVRVVKAFSEAWKTNSRKILEKLGLRQSGTDGRFIAYEGTMDDLKKWYYS